MPLEDVCVCVCEPAHGHAFIFAKTKQKKVQYVYYHCIVLQIKGLWKLCIELKHILKKFFYKEMLQT